MTKTPPSRQPKGNMVTIVELPERLRVWPLVRYVVLDAVGHRIVNASSLTSALYHASHFAEGGYRLFPSRKHNGGSE